MKNSIFKYRSYLKGVADVVVWSAMTLLAFLLRLDGDLGRYAPMAFQLTVILLVCKAILVFFMGTYRQSWRNTGFVDVYRVIFMVTMLTIPYMALTLITREIMDLQLSIPLSIPLLEFLLAVPALVAIRGLTRFMIKYRIPYSGNGLKEKRVLIAGAGESGTMIAREMQKNSNSGVNPVAFLDDDRFKRKQKILGLPVVGSLNELGNIIDAYAIDEVIVAMPSQSGEVIRNLVEQARRKRVQFRIIPSLYDLLSGKVPIEQIRKLDLEDLLKRKTVTLNTHEIRSYIKDRNVLVTGAGGSIGSEMVRQLSTFGPKRVILLDRDENALHELSRTIDEDYPDLVYAVCIADIQDYQRMEQIFDLENPELVFHTAAYKHVPLMESNIAEAIRNNILGTKNLIDISVKKGVSNFVNISTDKAVNPVSVMGATKKIAEQIVELGAQSAKGRGTYVSVRFGNVLGSRGSVVPTFKEQIRRKGPVTISHPEMMRYFMTISEAAQLVLQAGGFKQNGAIYYLEMGDPINIEQMARDMIRLSGFEPDVDIRITYTGIRPGEKMFEELLSSDEICETTRHEKIYMARKTHSFVHPGQKIDHLLKIAQNGDQVKIRREISMLVPTVIFNANKAM